MTARFFAACFTAVLTYVLVAPAPLAVFGTTGHAAYQAISRSIPDTLQHFFAYAAFAALWNWTVRGWRARLLIAMIAVLHGAAVELVQGLFPSRQADWRDLMANLAGTLAGTGIGWLAAEISDRRARANRERGRGDLLRAFERVLLYAVACTLAYMLWADRSSNDSSPQAPENAANESNGANARPQIARVEAPKQMPDDAPAETWAKTSAETPEPQPTEPQSAEPQTEIAQQTPDRNDAPTGMSAPPVKPATIVATSHPPSKPLILTDQEGRPRLALSVGSDGHPQVELRDEDGQVTVRLRAGDSQSGSVLVSNTQGTVELRADESGQLAFGMENDRGARLQAALTAEGHAEFVTRSSDESPGVTIRANADGSAELAVGRSENAPRTVLSALPAGTLELKMIGRHGEPGPALQLFDDSTAQLTLAGPGSRSGAHLIRFPDGSAVVSVTRDDGNPAATMVSYANGTALVAASSSDRAQQAELRAPAEGKARVGVVEADPNRPKPKAPVPAITDPRILSTP